MDMSMKCFIKESDLVTRRITGETIIVPIREHVGDLDSIYTLNETGTLVWQLIDGKTSISQIVDAICNEYDISPEEAEKDVIELIDCLEESGLIRSSVYNQGK